MERKIKFKVWNKENKEMTKPFPIYEIDNDIWFTKNTILMQYTGLKDKNGKEIYEGDIVKEDFYISRFEEEPLFTRDKEGKPILKKLKFEGFKPSDPIMKGKWKTKRQKNTFEVKSLRQIYEYLQSLEDKFSDKDNEKWRNGNCLEIVGNVYENPNLLNESI